MFKEYDKDKTGLTKDTLKALMKRLLNDECIIGKIPKLAEEEVTIINLIRCID